MSLAAMFLAQLKAADLPDPAIRHPLHQGRPLCLCYAWPDRMTGIVVCGGIGAMKEESAEAIAHAAQSAGWLVKTVRPKHLRDGSVVEWVRQALD